MRNIKSCKAGEIICDKGGNKSLVHGRLGVLIFRSDFYQFDLAHYRPMTYMEDVVREAICDVLKTKRNMLVDHKNRIAKDHEKTVEMVDLLLEIFDGYPY